MRAICGDHRFAISKIRNSLSFCETDSYIISSALVTPPCAGKLGDYRAQSHDWYTALYLCCVSRCVLVREVSRATPDCANPRGGVCDTGRIRGAALRKTAASLPRKPGLSLFLSSSRSWCETLARHVGACRRLPLFLELSGGGGASRPRKVVHYLQPCAGAITRLCARRRSHALSFFFSSFPPFFPAGSAPYSSSSNPDWFSPILI